jgi:hypothetical protein
VKPTWIRNAAVALAHRANVIRVFQLLKEVLEPIEDPILRISRVRRNVHGVPIISEALGGGVLDQQRPISAVLWLFLFPYFVEVFREPTRALKHSV